ncbi:hypothetical protein [Sporolactobacillus terrae]|uniref:hypothetical protein n=1 Tax=Sporolactobacillus terrae TaxID=269673 RepID=UPI00048F4C17|nr:hypothetical protein [Sporolactobacillus terrae]
MVADAKAKGAFTAEIAASGKRDAVKALIAQAPELITFGKSAIGDMEALIRSFLSREMGTHVPFRKKIKARKGPKQPFI